MNPLPALSPQRCVIYRRVSSAEQERASGPERQRRSCQAFAELHSLEIVADRFEDRSGTLPMAERPELSAALTDCLEHGAGILLVEERTRLARDEYAAYDALRSFATAGVKVLYADGSNGASDPAALLIDSIGHSIAAYDRRLIVARMAAGRKAKAAREPRSRAQGGKLPHGYRRTRSGGVEIEADAAAEVRRAFELVRDGCTVREAAAVLGWHPTMLARVLKRPEYKQAGDWRIVDPRVWNAAQAALAGRRKRAA
jgi:DNA invertase Pin-like site-specific DNA recombinase